MTISSDDDGFVWSDDFTFLKAHRKRLWHLKDISLRYFGGVDLAAMKIAVIPGAITMVLGLLIAAALGFDVTTGTVMLFLGVGFVITAGVYGWYVRGIDEEAELGATKGDRVLLWLDYHRNQPREISGIDHIAEPKTLQWRIILYTPNDVKEQRNA